MVNSGFFRQTLLFGMAAALLSAAAFAQPPGGQRGGDNGGQPQNRQRGGGFGGGFGGGGFGGGRGMALDRATLLRSDQVREELKIEETQAVSLDAALESFRDEQRTASADIDFTKLREMPEEERTALFEKMRKSREELGTKYDEMLAALLEPTQVERLDQIRLQVQLNGGLVAALKSDDLKMKLSLTDEQLAKLTAAEEATTEKRTAMMAELRGGGNGGERPDREAMQAAMEKMRASMEKLSAEEKTAAMAVLTASQTATLEKLKGAAIEIDMRSLMGGGRGQGGPPGGGPPGGGGRGGRPQGDAGGVPPGGGRPRGGRPAGN